MQPDGLRFWHRIICIVAFAIFWFEFAGNEDVFDSRLLIGGFSGLAEISSLLFLVAACLTFFLPRIAAVAALVAAFGYAPTYLSAVSPVLFKWISRDKNAVPETAFLNWDFSAMVGLAIAVVAGFLSIRILSRPTKALTASQWNSTRRP